VISKTRFINYSRCRRYCALDEIHKKKLLATISYEDLLEEEAEAKKNELYMSMYDEEDEDLIFKANEQLEAMMPYYRKIEILAGSVISRKFGKDVIFSLNTYDQKKFEAFYEDYRFYCFLDGFLKNGDSFSVFETKATTSKKFLNLGPNIKKVKESIFTTKIDDPQVLVLKEHYQPDLLNDQKYFTFRQKLFDKFNDCGQYVFDLAYQRFVIEHSENKEKFAFKKAKYYLVVLNSEYIHDGRVDEEGEPIYQDDIVSFIDLTSITEEYQSLIVNDFQVVEENLNIMDASRCSVSIACQRKKIKECPFLSICFDKLPKENSIFAYMGSHHGFGAEKLSALELYNQGYYQATDIPHEWLARRNNIIQRDCIDNNIAFFHHQKIKAGIEAIRYPIYHLDFETFPCPLPRFKGEKCYSQSLFQFSLHVEHAPGNCDKEKDHYSFLANNHEDCREKLMNQLCDFIKDDKGSVLVYNQAFEKTRLKEMAELYPDLRDKILSIRERIFDLLDIVKGNAKLFQALGFTEDIAKEINFYHNRLDGSFSIKKVLPIFSDLSYKELVVANGMDAVATYARFPKIEKAEFDKLYQALVEYCKQDTWAMVEILQKLKNIIDYSKDFV